MGLELQVVRNGSSCGRISLNNNQSLFVLTLAKEEITISMKILKVKI